MLREKETRGEITHSHPEQADKSEGVDPHPCYTPLIETLEEPCVQTLIQLHFEEWCSF